MKVAIVGCRDYVNTLDFRNALDNIFCTIDWPEWVLSGGARGTDELARLWAKEEELNYAEFAAEWKELGKSAGFKRNEKLVKACDCLMAFWDYKSKGTEHSIQLAKEVSKLVGIYNIVEQRWEYAS